MYVPTQESPPPRQQVYGSTHSTGRFHACSTSFVRCLALREFTTTFVWQRWMGGTMYLRAEMEYIIAKLDELFDLEDKDALSMFIGKRILVVHRVPKVS